MTFFSIVIPAYNAVEHINDCLHSVLDQKSALFSFEILVVDDCSSDSTWTVLAAMRDTFPGTLHILKTDRNSGPGEARNVGLESAKGEWIIFLDSDDRLAPNALEELHKHISNFPNPDNLDLIAIDWEYDKQSNVKSARKGGRYDFESLTKPKNELLKDYVSLGMDGSVIYSIIRNKLIQKNKLRFDAGIHEDVDYVFKVYFYANEISILNKKIYIKRNRQGSIVNSISKHHIDGYFRAYAEILSTMQLLEKAQLEPLLQYYYTGLIGVVAVKLRDIVNGNLGQIESFELYSALYDNWKNSSQLFSTEQFSIPNTKYVKIWEYFISTMSAPGRDVAIVDNNIRQFLESIAAKSWSCYDLHNSIFLAPTEIRTCCKRFFVNNKQKGDVVLIDTQSTNMAATADVILKKKRELYKEINRGESEECSGCPFLEFKEWGYINTLDIKQISFEHHTICNMRCVFCDEKYYGGQKETYAIEQLIDELIALGSLSNLRSIVWGGGEPVLHPLFPSIIHKIANNFPNVKQRVITNSSVFSPVIQELLQHDKITITTSVDAGTESTFKIVKGGVKIQNVLENLSKYATANAKGVTIKYIILEENAAYSELHSFAQLIKQFNLEACNFQISCNFKCNTIPRKIALAAVSLYGLLMDMRCNIIFFDELLRQRLPSFDECSIQELKDRLKLVGLDHALADPQKYGHVAIWGAGIQTKMLVEDSFFFKNAEIDFIVDSYASASNNSAFEIPLYTPEKLLDSDIPVLISAVQRTPALYQEALKLGIDPSRIIREAVI